MPLYSRNAKVSSDDNCLPTRQSVAGGRQKACVGVEVCGWWSSASAVLLHLPLHSNLVLNPGLACRSMCTSTSSNTPRAPASAVPTRLRRVARSNGTAIRALGHARRRFLAAFGQPVVAGLVLRRRSDFRILRDHPDSHALTYMTCWRSDEIRRFRLKVAPFGSVP